MNKIYQLLLTNAFFFFMVSTTWSTTVDVYAEGGYTDTKFTVDIYANINPSAYGSLLSAGVKLTYPSDKLQNPVAGKNEQEWYLGTLEHMYPYIEPNVDSAGEVFFLLGKFNQQNPQEGVSGDRIHLGSVFFDRIPSTNIPTETDFSLSSGKAAPFVDFATVTGHELDDSVNFSISTITTSATLNMRGVIRILQVLTGMNPDLPVRISELDTDDNGVVGLSDVIILLKEAAE